MSKKTKMGSKSIALIISAIALLIITTSTSYYFLSILPQQRADQLELEQRKLDIAEQEKAEKIALEKEKTKKELDLKQSELERKLEADCQKQIADLRFSNIERGFYNSYTGNCDVKYKNDDGTYTTAPLKDMVKAPRSSINFDEFYRVKNDKGHYVLSGQVSSDCSKISITAHNFDRYIDEEPWVLQGYKPGDTSFSYYISSSFNTSDANGAQGLNEYTATAICGGGIVTDTELIFFSENDL